MHSIILFNKLLLFWSLIPASNAWALVIFLKYTYSLFLDFPILAHNSRIKVENFHCCRRIYIVLIIFTKILEEPDELLIANHFDLLFCTIS